MSATTEAMTIVVKVGTSSLTDTQGHIDLETMRRLCTEIAAARVNGHRVVLVTSAAVAAGLPVLGFASRPTDVGTLQAVAAVGQPRLMRHYDEVLSALGIVCGQVLLTPLDFIHRSQYLHGRDTLRRLLSLGVLPIVNENDTVADDELRYGDNDRLAALVAHLVSADLLVLLTDTPGLYTADPRLDEGASLIAEIAEVDAALERVAGGAGTERGSGGMASKLAAAKIASWSGVRAVIAGAGTDGVLAGAIAGQSVGTVVKPRERRLSSRKLWIAFARGSSGTLVVDEGARRALVESGRSLLPAGVRAVDGVFEIDDAVEIVCESDRSRPFAKGLVRYPAGALAAIIGRRTADLPDGANHEVVHRDDLVILP